MGRHFFKRHQGRGSYDLFSTYNRYLPGVGGMFGMFGLFLVGSALGSMINAALQLVLGQDFVLEYGTLISYPVMFIPPMLYASVKSRMSNIFDNAYALDSSNFGQRGGFVMAMTVSLATIAAACLMEPVSALLPQMPEWFEKIMNQVMEGSPLWATLISVSVFAPFFEEWLCRGIVLRGLLNRTSPAAAICISAAFFAILHMNPWQAVPAFGLGLLFGYVYYKTGSLRLTMLMHCVNNTMAVILAQIPALKEADTLMDVMSPWAYACTYIAFVLILACAIIIIQAIPQKEGNLGGCDRVDNMSDLPTSIN